MAKLKWKFTCFDCGSNSYQNRLETEDYGNVKVSEVKTVCVRCGGPMKLEKEE